MSIKNALASVPVKDMSSAVQWYERLFGSTPPSSPRVVRSESSKDTHEKWDFMTAGEGAWTSWSSV